MKLFSAILVLLLCVSTEFAGEPLRLDARNPHYFSFQGRPVVLVTSLDSREDREKGVEAGANAYIVKSSFDQSNLLETIGRLL